MSSVEAAVRADIGRLGELRGIQPSLAEIAYALAASLDAIASGEALVKGPDPTASIAKELRSTLEALTEGQADDIRAGQAKILELLSAPVGNPKKPAAGDARRPGGRRGAAAGNAADAVAAARHRRSAGA